MMDFLIKHKLINPSQHGFLIGPCRVPGYPTDESSTRFHCVGSITRIGNVTLINCILINYLFIIQPYPEQFAYFVHTHRNSYCLILYSVLICAQNFA